MHAGERVEKLFRIKTINSRIDFADFLLFFRSVLLFDDPVEKTFFVADDASVTGRVIQFDGQKRASRAFSAVRLMLLDEPDESFLSNHRHIAG